MAERGKIVGVDLGEKRVGVAVSDEAGAMAHPRSVIPNKGKKALAATLGSLAEEVGAQSFVVGLPKNMDGSIGPSGQRAQEFARYLEAVSGLPVALFDERLTTSQATREMIGLGLSRRDRKKTLDGASAVLILEGYLRKEDRERNLQSKGSDPK